MSDPNNPYGPPSGDQPDPYGGQPANPYGVQPTPTPTPTPPPPPPVYGDQPNPYAAPPTAAYGGQPGWPQVDPNKRPGTVTAACIIAMLTSGLVLLLTGAGLIGLLVARDDIMDEIEKEIAADPNLEGLAPDSLFAGILGVVLVVVVWCAIAVLLSIFAMRRSNVARILLVISSVVTALISLLAILSIVSGLTLILGIVVTVMLLNGRAAEWYRNKDLQPSLPVGTTQPWS